MANATWTGAGAMLVRGHQSQAYDSLNEMTASLTGSVLPIAALFEWLNGRPVATQGWKADLSRLPEGRLVATRVAPPPSAVLRVVLDR